MHSPRFPPVCVVAPCVRDSACGVNALGDRTTPDNATVDHHHNKDVLIWLGTAHYNVKERSPASAAKIARLTAFDTKISRASSQDVRRSQGYPSRTLESFMPDYGASPCYDYTTQTVQAYRYRSYFA